MDILVSTDWLAQHLGDADMVIIDASAHLPAAGRDAAAEFDAAHITNARFLDLPGLKDDASPVPAALPTAEQFIRRMQEMGIRATDRVVLYDDSVLRSSARAYFIFTLFGFDNVAVLDGGLAKWTAEGRAVSAGSGSIAPTSYTGQHDDPSCYPSRDPSLIRRRVRSKADMLSNITARTEQVVDARDAGRFTAEIEDAVHGLAGGHIPGARNLHFAQLLRDDGTFKQGGELRAVFDQAGVDLDRAITASCGSGMTASVVLFALALLGHKNAALYDGSWSEWGADPGMPKETGPAT